MDEVNIPYKNFTTVRVKATMFRFYPSGSYFAEDPDGTHLGSSGWGDWDEWNYPYVGPESNFDSHRDNFFEISRAGGETKNYGSGPFAAFPVAGSAIKGVDFVFECDYRTTYTLASFPTDLMDASVYNVGDIININGEMFTVYQNGVGYPGYPNLPRMFVTRAAVPANGAVIPTPIPIDPWAMSDCGAPTGFCYDFYSIDKVIITEIKLVNPVS
jgi:hypothetical protein